MCGPSVVSVLVLVSSIGIASTATTSNPSAVKSSRSASVSGRSIPNYGARKVITFRQNFGSDEEVCTCVAFHKCDNETSTMITSLTADGQERCSGDEVCCRPKNPLPIPTSTESGGISRVPTDEQNFESDEVCTCVAIRECDSVTSTIIYGPTADGQERCSGDEVCCRPKTPSPIPTSTESGDVSRLPPDGQNFESDEVCTCVAIRECDSVTSTIIYGPTADGQERCIGDEVCCRPKTPSPAPTSTESGGVSPVPKVEQECGIKGKTSNPSEADIDSIISIGVKISNDDENGETVFGEFPWMVALLKTNDYSADGEVICGASLLSPLIVLTAAHCVNGIDKQLLRVRVGEYNIGSDENESLPHQDRFVYDVRIHPNFFPRRLYNDLALLSVDKPFVYDYHINSICAPLVGSPYIVKNSYDPKRCWSIGWGKDNVTHKITQSKLKKVELPIVDRKECQRRLRTTGLGTAFTVDSSFICAGGQKGYDTCKGDGGGPLFCASRANDNKVIQAGIVSWGVGCGTTIPGLYASLEANSEWLTTEFNALSVFRTES